MRNHAYIVRYFVALGNSSLIIITWDCSVTTLFYNDTQYSVSFMMLKSISTVFRTQKYIPIPHNWNLVYYEKGQERNSTRLEELRQYKGWKMENSQFNSMYVQHFPIHHSVQVDYKSHFLLSNGYLGPLSLYTSENKKLNRTVYSCTAFGAYFIYKQIFTFKHINYFLWHLKCLMFQAQKFFVFS